MTAETVERRRGRRKKEKKMALIFIMFRKIIC
jgi:hypothetical protein